LLLRPANSQTFHLTGAPVAGGAPFVALEALSQVDRLHFQER